MALSTQRIHAELQDHKAKIKIQLSGCAEQYEQGLSLIDRSEEDWKLKRSASIEDIYSYFVSAHHFMKKAGDQLSKCKTELDITSLDMASRSSRLSEDISKTNQNLTGIKASLSMKEKDVAKKAEDLKRVEKELSEKKEALEEKEKGFKVATGVAAGAVATAGALLILGPASAPFLAAAATADATAAMIVLKAEISKLERKVDSGKLECRLTSEELDDLKDEERNLESDKDSKTQKINSLDAERESLGRQIAEIADILQKVKACYTVLGLIINKFETLENDSNPEYCYDLSALKIPILELENSMKQRMLTF